MKHTKYKLEVISKDHNGMFLLVDKPVIDFLELHDVEVKEDKKYYIVNNTKYLLRGEVKGL